MPAWNTVKEIITSKFGVFPKISLSLQSPQYYDALKLSSIRETFLHARPPTVDRLFKGLAVWTD